MGNNLSYFYRYSLPNGEIQEPVTSSTRLLLERAHDQGFQIEIPVNSKVITLRKNEATAQIIWQLPSQTSALAYVITSDKGLTRATLIQSGISIVPGYTIRKHFPKQSWLDIFNALQKPLVVKPTHGNHGASVFMNIARETEYIQAIESCFSYPIGEDAGVVIEEFFQGDEYRILTTSHQVLAILKRIPANVTGDGTHTILQLIKKKNKDPRRSSSNKTVLHTIEVDNHVVQHLHDQQLDLNYVPRKNQIIFLRQNSNISTGGDSIDVTAIAHPTYFELTTRIMDAIPGLAFAGVDIMTTDIQQPPTPGTYAVIEVNNSPGFDIHEDPVEGEKRPVTNYLLQEISAQL